MERVAEPLRLMGADVKTTDGHAPVAIRGGALRGIRYELPVPSAQVKSAILFAGLNAEGKTAIVEPAAGRNHTEVALAALGAPLEVDGSIITVDAFQHEGFEGDVPGDPSSAAFLMGAAAVTGSRVAVRDVGLNPSRTAFVNVMRRMGMRIGEQERWESLGEPAGVLEVDGTGPLRPVMVSAAELPLVIDEVPVLAAVAAHAEGVSSFEGAGELRVKESDRLAGIVGGIVGMGGDARVDDDTLTIGGGGLAGGNASAIADHRIAMALAVAALGARSDCFIEGMEWAAISFPGFVDVLVSLGARAETT
jgi:3-phosphoshikimate 1-carboxyvinyltransferase